MKKKNLYYNTFYPEKISITFMKETDKTKELRFL